MSKIQRNSSDEGGKKKVISPCAYLEIFQEKQDSQLDLFLKQPVPWEGST